jgi:hypothetical protein
MLLSNCLDKNVGKVVIQLSASKSQSLPSGLKYVDDERLQESVARKICPTGEQIIQATLDCSTESLPTGLMETGYVLADAFHQVRIDRHSESRRYHMVRYVFFRKEVNFLSPRLQSKETLSRAHKSLSWALKSAMWRVRAYRNPSEDISGGLYWMSINLEMRKPYTSKNGELITEWQKNELGQRIGEAAVPRSPKHRMVIVQNMLQLESLSNKL